MFPICALRIFIILAASTTSSSYELVSLYFLYKDKSVSITFSISSNSSFVVNADFAFSSNLFPLDKSPPAAREKAAAEKAAAEKAATEKAAAEKAAREKAAREKAANNLLNVIRQILTNGKMSEKINLKMYNRNNLAIILAYVYTQINKSKINTLTFNSIEKAISYLEQR